MQRSSSDWLDSDGRDEEEAEDRGAVTVSAESDIEREVACWSEFSFEASSYACALQGEPIGCLTHFTGHQIVAGELPFERHFGVCRFEELSQAFDAGSRDDRIHASSGNEYRRSAQISLLGRLVYEHWAKKNRALQNTGFDEHHSRRDVGTVGVA